MHTFNTKAIWNKVLRMACILGVGMLLGQGVACSSESAVTIPAPTNDEHAAANVHAETTVLGKKNGWAQMERLVLALLSKPPN